MLVEVNGTVLKSFRREKGGSSQFWSGRFWSKSAVGLAEEIYIGGNPVVVSHCLKDSQQL